MAGARGLRSKRALSSSAIIPNTETPRENDTLISDFGTSFEGSSTIWVG